MIDLPVCVSILTEMLHIFLFSRNPIGSEDEAIEMFPKFLERSTPPYLTALRASGFVRIPDNNRTGDYRFLPCPFGTFVNVSSKGAEGCIKCPPGMYVKTSYS